jgi:hypothetical protein
MKKLCLALAATVAAGQLAAVAGTLPGAIGDDYLHAPDLTRVTVGANYENIQRRIALDAGPVTDLEAYSASLFVGYDLRPWFTLFGTMGLSDRQGAMDFVPAGQPAATAAGGGDDPKTKWSVGANANLLRWEMRAPRITLGDRVTLRAFLEYSAYEFEDAPATVEWTEILAALRLAYERIERNAMAGADELFRLVLYAGPALSVLDGSIEYGGTSLDFDEDESLGLLAGADIYLTSSFSIGGQAQVFDYDGEDLAAQAALRYHF